MFNRFGRSDDCEGEHGHRAAAASLRLSSTTLFTIGTDDFSVMTFHVVYRYLLHTCDCPWVAKSGPGARTALHSPSICGGWCHTTLLHQFTSHQRCDLATSGHSSCQETGGKKDTTVGLLTAAPCIACGCRLLFPPSLARLW